MCHLETAFSTGALRYLKIANAVDILFIELILVATVLHILRSEESRSLGWGAIFASTKSVALFAIKSMTVVQTAIGEARVFLPRQVPIGTARIPD